jgi:hypothetical protein
MSEEDVNETSDTSTEDVEEESSEDESLEHSESDADTSEGDKSTKSIPYSRFKAVNDAKKAAEGIANWYRHNVGDPKDVEAFNKWKSSQVKKAEQAEDDGDISAKKLAEIRKVMRKADPEYAAMVEQQKQEKEARIEAQFDEAEDCVRELAEAEYGLKGKTAEGDISWLAKQTMLAIRGDEKLVRLWNLGNTERCVKKAFAIVKERQENLGKRKVSALSKEAADKRKVSKLPTLPSASGSISGKEDPKREKGVNKQAHTEAWEVFQQHIHES